MLQYPKIETLYKRDSKTFKLVDEVRFDEFKLVTHWHVTEKIHGTNIRIEWDGTQVKFAGRKSEDPAHMPQDLLKFLTEKYTPELMTEAFGANKEVTLFGEGHGPGIQKGGGAYNGSKDFVLFDIRVGHYWLEPDAVEGVGRRLNTNMVPVIGKAMTSDMVTGLVRNGFDSILALSNTGAAHPAEGVIAKTVPGLLTRQGKRVMFKLKTEDFAKEPAQAVA